MRNIQHNLETPGAHWFAPVSMFCTAMVAPVSGRQVRATKIDPAAAGGPFKRGTP